MSKDAVVSGLTVPAQEIVGPTAVPAATRSGDDTRRRGWFWHWNSIVTQYAPLIGLKGVGLLNSYTVWTDRREESPHRGYAFPSQQSEADFYGEDRAELITINKILVALDLIEIRKEMVLRVDDQGRRWKVPHNFYRVKDHDDGSSLKSRDVLRVVELADRDSAVYRYVRRIFSPRFSPIDANNVWAQILIELRETDVWRKLAAKTEKDERRASDRTRAGHAARKSSLFLSDDGDTTASDEGINDSRTVQKKRGGGTSVASTNNGLAIDVEATNNGSEPNSTTVVDAANRAPETDVELSNTTYNQYPLTTTTTTRQKNSSEKRRPNGTVDTAVVGSHRAVTSSENLVTGRESAGPAGREAPTDAPGEARALQVFQDANGRAVTAAERHLLSGLASRFDAAARAQAIPGRESGWSWVVAGIYEAVESGSAFVAPRRLREILTRWERDGLPASEIVPSLPGATPVIQRADVEPARSQVTESLALGARFPEIDLPHGFGSRRTWEFAVGLLRVALEAKVLAALVTGTEITGYANGEVTIAVANALQAEQISGGYRELIARKVSEAMRRPVRIALMLPEEDRVIAREATTERPTPRPGKEPEIPVFLVPECGMPSTQVWAAVIDELSRNHGISRLNIETWLRSTQLLHRKPDGGLVVGAAHLLAQQRITSRFGGALAAATQAILGRRVEIEIAVTRDWLAEHAAGFHDGEAEAIGVA